MKEKKKPLTLEMTKGGKRRSEYSDPVKPKKKDETWLQRWRREAAEFRMKMIDEQTK